MVQPAPVRQYYSIRAIFSIISLANSENPQVPHRKQVSRLAALEAENAELQVANKRLAEMSSEMEAFKKVVATMQEKENGGVRTAALIQ
jgi:hypothetical protein